MISICSLLNSKVNGKVIFFVDVFHFLKMVDFAKLLLL